MQAQDIYNGLKRRKHDVLDVGTAIFLEWVQFTVNFIYDKAKKIEPSRFIQSQSFVVTTTPQVESLPINFQDLNQTGCGIYKEGTKNKIGMTEYGSTKEGYYLEGKNIIFTGGAQAYVMRFIPKPPTIKELSTYITSDGTSESADIAEDRHLEHVIKAVDVLYEQWDSDPQMESLADFRFIRALGDMFDGYSRTPQVKSIPNPANDF